MKLRTRRRLTQLACLLLGCGYAYVMASHLGSLTLEPVVQLNKAKVSFRSGGQPAVTAPALATPEKRQRIQVETPIKGQRPPKTPKAPEPPSATSPTDKAVEAPAPIPERIEGSSALFPGQPAPPMPDPVGKANPTNLPTVEANPSPYPEQPGGPVLVIGLLVDHRGKIIDAKILVPSSHVMDDISYTLAANGQEYGKIDPPLMPGETRWVEMRIYYPEYNTQLP